MNSLNLYQSEIKCGLHRRNIKAKLTEHESAVNELCNMRPENARCDTSSNYQVEEVQTAIKELKLGKSVDPTGLIRELFIRGGSGLVRSITAMFNAFKKNFDVPSQWDDILITTMFKNKGSWKKLDNCLGIFILSILQLIYEEVLINRISCLLQKNMLKFQNGGVKGKGVTDNLFILKGIIDHSKYLGKGVLLPFMVKKNVLTVCGYRIASMLYGIMVLKMIQESVNQNYIMKVNLKGTEVPSVNLSEAHPINHAELGMIYHWSIVIVVRTNHDVAWYAMNTGYYSIQLGSGEPYNLQYQKEVYNPTISVNSFSAVSGRLMRS